MKSKMFKTCVKKTSYKIVMAGATHCQLAFEIRKLTILFWKMGQMQRRIKNYCDVNGKELLTMNDNDN